MTRAGKTYQLCISIVKHHYRYYYIKNEETSEIAAKQHDLLVCSDQRINKKILS